LLCSAVGTNIFLLVNGGGGLIISPLAPDGTGLPPPLRFLKFLAIIE